MGNILSKTAITVCLITSHGTLALDDDDAYNLAAQMHGRMNQRGLLDGSTNIEPKRDQWQRTRARVEENKKVQQLAAQFANANTHGDAKCIGTHCPRKPIALNSLCVQHLQRFIEAYPTKEEAQAAKGEKSREYEKLMRGGDSIHYYCAGNEGVKGAFIRRCLDIYRTEKDEFQLRSKRLIQSKEINIQISGNPNAKLKEQEKKKAEIVFELKVVNDKIKAHGVSIQKMDDEIARLRAQIEKIENEKKDAMQIKAAHESLKIGLIDSLAALQKEMDDAGDAEMQRLKKAAEAKEMKIKYLSKQLMTAITDADFEEAVIEYMYYYGKDNLSDNTSEN